VNVLHNTKWQVEAGQPMKDDSSVGDVVNGQEWKGAGWEEMMLVHAMMVSDMSSNRWEVAWFR